MKINSRSVSPNKSLNNNSGFGSDDAYTVISNINSNYKNDNKSQSGSRSISGQTENKEGEFDGIEN